MLFLKRRQSTSPDTPPRAIPTETMAIWHDNLDLSTIPLAEPDTLTLFDTYDLDDIEWYPQPRPLQMPSHHPTQPSSPQPKSAKS